MNKFYSLLIFITYILPQVDANFSFESKYAKDKESSLKSPTFFENFVDINLYIDNLYIFTQLEYSSPPLIGLTKENLSDVLNIFYIQSFNDKIDLTIGNLYLLYGKGLSLHTYEDQNIAFDNSIYGIESIYHINDNFDFYTILGRKEVRYRWSPASKDPTLDIPNRVFSIGTNGYFNNINFHYLGMLYEQDYSSDNIDIMKLFDGLIGYYLNDGGVAQVNQGLNFKAKNLEHNFSLSYFANNIEINFEKSIVFYQKLFGGRDRGSREYLSSYFNIIGFGNIFSNINLIIEHKDYNTPYLLSLFSNPPTGYRDSNSALASRNSHSLNFNNEFGHQLEINKTFNSGMFVLFNYAFAMHHNDEWENILIDNSDPENSDYEWRKNGEEDKVNVLDLYGYLFNLLSDKNYIMHFEEYKPYRQLYFEFSDWDNKDQFYYKFGYDYYQEYLVGKMVLSKTFPTQFTFKSTQGNSITIYFEYQDELKTNYSNFENNIIYTSSEKHFYWYLSPSYNHFGNWSCTMFLDKEIDGDSWIGYDYTINLKNSSQLSLFYGSQKGGIVCANGSCVEQPDFEEGMKATYRASF